MLTEKQLQQLKERYFAKNVKRTGIPLKFYELPAHVIEEEERARAEKKAAKARLVPTRGDVSFHRLVRREVGM